MGDSSDTRGAHRKRGIVRLGRVWLRAQSVFLCAFPLAFAGVFLASTDTLARIDEFFTVAANFHLQTPSNSGAGQTLTTRQLSPLPLRALVLDEASKPVRGAHVRFRVESAPVDTHDAYVTSPESVSDEKGIASTLFVAADTPGAYVVEAVPLDIDFVSDTPIRYTITVISRAASPIQFASLAVGVPPQASFLIDAALSAGASVSLKDALDSGTERPLTQGANQLWTGVLFSAAGPHSVTVTVMRAGAAVAGEVFEIVVPSPAGFRIVSPADGTKTGAASVTVQVPVQPAGFAAPLSAVSVSLDGGSFVPASHVADSFALAVRIDSFDGRHAIVARSTDQGADILSPPIFVDFLDTRFVTGFRDGNLGAFADPTVTTLAAEGKVPSQFRTPFLQKEEVDGITPFRDFFQNNIESVDPFSGNLVLRQTDLTLPGRGELDLTISRVYNQNEVYQGLYRLVVLGFLHDAQKIFLANLQRLAAENNFSLSESDIQQLDQSIADLRAQSRVVPNPLGLGWRFDFPSFDPARSVLTYVGGNVIPIVLDAQGRFQKPGFTFTFERRPDNTFALTEKNGVKYTFDQQGRLSTIADRTQNNVMSFTYRPGTRYPAQSLLSKILDTVGREVLFVYDIDDRLTEIRLGDRVIKKFFYNDAASLAPEIQPRFLDAADKLIDWPVLTRIEDAMGRSLAIKYGEGPVGNLVQNASDELAQNLSSLYATFSGDLTNAFFERGFALHALVDQGKLTDDEAFHSFKGFEATRNTNRGLFVKEVVYPTGGKTGYDYSDFKRSEPIQYNVVTGIQNGVLQTQSRSFLTLVTYRAVKQTRIPGGPDQHVTNYTYDFQDAQNRQVTTISEIRRKLVLSYISELDDTFSGQLIRAELVDDLAASRTFGNVIRRQEFISDKFRNNILEINTIGDNIQPSAPPTFFVRRSFSSDEERQLHNFTSMSVVGGADGTILSHVFYQFHPKYRDQVTEITGDAVHTRMFFDDEGFDPAASGQPTRIEVVDGDGKTVSRMTKRYNSIGQLVETTDALGNRTVFEFFDQFHLLKSVSKFDAAGKLLSITKNDYDFLTGLPTAQTDALGHTVKFDYDALFRKTLTEFPNGTKEQIIFREKVGGDPLNNQVELIDAAGGRIVNVNDGLGRLTEIRAFFTEENRFLSRKFDYDARDNVVAVTDPMGAVTRFTLDALDRKLVTTFPDGITERLDYTDNFSASGLAARKVEYTDPLGFKKELLFDVQDKLTRMTEWADLAKTKSSTSRIDYDRRGNVTGLIDPRGFKGSLEYNALDKLVRKIDALANAVSYEFDAAGNMIKATDAKNAVTEFRYDGFGALTDLIRHNGGQTLTRKNVYDANGQKIQEMDENGHSASFVYDAMGRQVEIHRPVASSDYAEIVERVDYNAVGNPTRLTDGRGTVTSLKYDSLKRLIAQIVEIDNDPTGVSTQDIVTQFQYNDRGQKTLEISPNGNQTRFVYDKLNANLVGVVRKALNLPSEYAPNLDFALLTQLRLAQFDVEITTFEYDAADNKTAEFDPLGNRTTFEYDGLNRLTSRTDPLGLTERFAYDEAGNRTQSTDVRSHATSFTYDALGRLKNILKPLGVESEFDYDPVGNKTAERVKRAGRFLETHFAFDDLGRLTATTDPMGNVEQFFYDAVGNRTERRDAESNIFQFQYDEINRLIRRIEILKTAPGAEGSPSTATRTSTTAYDQSGNILRQTDPLNRSTVFKYDRASNMVERREVGTLDPASEHPADIVTRFKYDKNGNRTDFISPTGEVVSSVYDPLDRLIKTVQRFNKADANASVSSSSNDITFAYQYDKAGNLARQVDALGRPVEYAYDALGRRIRTTDVLGNANQTTYDDLGAKTAFIDPEGNKTERVFDALNRLSQVAQHFKDAAKPPITTDYVYDEIGNRTEERYKITGQIHTNRYEYDDIGRLKTERWIDAGAPGAGDRVSTYDYDKNGNLVEVARPDGSLLRRTITLLNLAAKVTVDGKTAQAFEYDLSGNVAQAFDSTGVTLRDYDMFGRLSRERRQKQLLSATPLSDLKYEYDASSRRAKMTLDEPVPQGFQRIEANYSFDNFGRVAAITNPNSGIGVKYRYDKMSRIVQRTNPDKTFTNYNYDQVYRLIEQNTFNNQNQKIDFVKYDYDRVGNRTAKTEAGGVEKYTYDDIYRLTHVSYADGGSEAFEYDEFGNRLKNVVDNDTQEVYAYSGRNELTRVSATSSRVSTPIVRDFTYDARGNMVSEASGADVTTYAYDPLDRLTHVMGANAPPNSPFRYDYDAFGRRVARGVGDLTMRLVQDGDNTIAEVNDGTNRVERDFLHGQTVDEVVGQTEYVDPAFDANDPKKTSLAYHQDAIQSVRFVTNMASGSKTIEYAYSAFGKLRKVSGEYPNRNPYTFTGRQLENPQGLMYYRARFYQASIGRFMSHDPDQGDLLNPPSLNKYVYTVNNPINFMDPSGMRGLFKRFTDWVRDETRDVKSWAQDHREILKVALQVVASVVVAIVAPYALAPLISSIGSAIGVTVATTAGALTGFAGAIAVGVGQAGVSAAFGANGRDILASFVGGTLTAGLAGGVDVGKSFQGGFQPKVFADAVVRKAVAGGIGSAAGAGIRGSPIGRAFTVGLVSGAADIVGHGIMRGTHSMEALGKLGFGEGTGFFARVSTAGVVGGLTSMGLGGSFGEGFIQGTFTGAISDVTYDIATGHSVSALSFARGLPGFVGHSLINPIGNFLFKGILGEVGNIVSAIYQANFNFARGFGFVGGVAGGVGNIFAGLGNIVTGDVGLGFSQIYGGTSQTLGAVNLLGNAAIEMRRQMVVQSMLGQDNISALGKWSEGFLGDLFKLGGGRNDKSNPNAKSPLGGQQQAQGFLGFPLTNKGINYNAGGFIDHLVEAFAGPHDFLNSSFWYDNSTGDIRQGMSGVERAFGEILNYSDVSIATPFVLFSLLPKDPLLVQQMRQASGPHIKVGPEK